MTVSASKPHSVGIWMTAAIWSLLFTRWFVPAESTAEGATLWIAMLTALIGASWAWWQSRDESGHVVVDVWDRAVWWLVIAQVASGCAVLATVGNKRASLNMIWEWTTIGLQFLLLRQTLTSLRARISFLQAAVILWSVIAAFGIWQQFVLYPSNVRNYAQMRRELTELQADRTQDPAQVLRNRDRISQIVKEFVAQRIPLEGPQAGLFERRLESKEPIGFFVLANSLGGMLGTTTLLLVGALVASSRRRRDVFVIAVPLLVVATCLLLTKSRTALCGTFAGSVILAWWLSRKYAVVWQRVAIFGGAALLSVAGLVLLAIKLGGLDAQVLTESTKSLTYRLQYWTATLEVWRDHPWLGVGPGNFRWHYLQHKLPQASEEISDPHNFLFDVTANAGVFGLASVSVLLSVLALTVKKLIRLDMTTKSIGASANRPQKTQGLGSRAIGLATLLVATWQTIFDGQVESDLVVVGSLAAIMTWLSERFSLAVALQEREDLVVAGTVAAAVSLLVHLLGAGGFASPAILNWLLALFAVLSLSGRDIEPIVRERPALFFRVAALSYLVLAVLIAKFGWMPSVTAQGLVTAGDQDFAGPGQFTAAAAKYERARDIDPLASAPWMGLSRVSFAKWTIQDRDEDFQEGVAAALRALERDPFNAKIVYELGEWWVQRYRKTPEPGHIRMAIAALERAVAMYPTNPTWNADLARAYKLANLTSEAQQQALKALSLNEINHAAGHIDRYLPDTVADEMQSLAKSP